MGELSKLPNIGEVVEKQLEEVGITCLSELEKAGAKDAWLRVKAVDYSACIHRLYSFEGAIRGIQKKELPLDIKNELKQFYNLHK
jgi:DNA transformation protein